MCEICNKLIGVPKTSKAKVILNETESKYTNYDRTFIEVNHTEKGEKYAFITHEIQMKDYKTWSHPVDIKYCPFCGRYLLNKKNERITTNGDKKQIYRDKNFNVVVVEERV